MTWEQWWEHEGCSRMKSIAKKRCKNTSLDADDLFQKLTVASWKIYKRYGSDNLNEVLGVAINRTIIDHWRTTQKPFEKYPHESLTEDHYNLSITDPVTSEDVIDLLFDIAHRTGNLTAVRLIRAFVNPNKLQLEQERGKLTWQKVYQFVGITDNERRSAFKLLRKAFLTRYPENTEQIVSKSEYHEEPI